MFRHAGSWMMLGGFLALVCALGLVDAGDKKPADKGKEEKKVAPLVDKKSELNKDDERDTKLTKSLRKVFAVKLEKDRIYRIELKSEKFDAVLRLEDSAGKEVAFDDDSAGNLNARIWFKASAAGEYTIVATCHRGGGPFTIHAIEAVGAKVASEFQAEPIALKWQDEKVQHIGLLEEKDALALGRHYKVFTLDFEADKSYRISNKSGDFDSYLILEDADGKRLAENDDAEGSNARLTYKCVKAGPHRIIATSLPSRKTGKFALEIQVEKAK